MDPLRIEATVDTPSIILDPKSNQFEISGKSYPEDTKEFYGSVLAWMDLYVANPNADTTFVFKLKYFNSSSYKPVFDIISKLSLIKKKNKQVKVEWHYKNGDSDMLEAGEEFADLSDVDFTYHPF
ncbi:MAG: DUF1987 domain-containing protein [Bacteroidota bacterium]